MDQPCGEADLLGKPVCAQRLRQGGGKELDRDFPAQLAVMAAENRAHAAPSQLTGELETERECAEDVWLEFDGAHVPEIYAGAHAFAWVNRRPCSRMPAGRCCRRPAARLPRCRPPWPRQAGYLRRSRSRRRGDRRQMTRRARPPRTQVLAPEIAYAPVPSAFTIMTVSEKTSGVVRVRRHCDATSRAPCRVQERGVGPSQDGADAAAVNIDRFQVTAGCRTVGEALAIGRPVAAEYTERGDLSQIGPIGSHGEEVACGTGQSPGKGYARPVGRPLRIEVAGCAAGDLGRMGPVSSHEEDVIGRVGGALVGPGDKRNPGRVGCPLGLVLVATLVCRWSGTAPPVPSAFAIAICPPYEKMSSPSLYAIDRERRVKVGRVRGQQQLVCPRYQAVGCEAVDPHPPGTRQEHRHLDARRTGLHDGRA